MSKRFFICSVAEANSDYEADNFARCEGNSGHFMHDSTTQKGAFRRVRKGDIAILKYHDNLVAYGEVIDVANDKTMPGLGDWNHRIMVDRWIWHNPSNHMSGVSNYGVSWNVEEGSQWATIKKVKAKYGLSKCREINPGSDLIRAILHDITMKNYISLLEGNKNIILHGAPGTGKTYLATQIAKAMDAETEFVQFHPNYDYTDFVEGLRPVKGDDEHSICFELRPGIFRQFCERALKNLLDSEKAPEKIKSERGIDERYDVLVDKIDNGEVSTITQRLGKPLRVTVSNQRNIVVQAGKDGKLHTVSRRRIAKLAEVYGSTEELKAISNLSQAIRDAIGGCQTSGYWAVLNALYLLDMPEDTTSTLSTDADTVRRRNFVFIIDEINRAEISKVLGELFFSVDPGYRGKDGKVRTQYSNLIDEPTAFDDAVGDGTMGWFYVPENVYVIGTMNDIDRSVDAMDFAMRRRFAFREVGADQSMSMLDSPDAWGGAMPSADVIADIKAHMTRLNQAIVSDVIGLPKAYMTGGAYYLKYALYKNADNPFDLLWKYHLAPLLTEYLRGSDDDGSKLGYLRQQYDGD